MDRQLNGQSDVRHRRVLQHLLVVLEDERRHVVDALVVDARYVDGRLPVADAALARPVIGTW